MTRWPRKSEKFKVRISYDKKGQAKITIPKPLVEGFNKPKTVTIVMADTAIEMHFTPTTANVSNVVSNASQIQAPNVKQEEYKPLWQRIREQELRELEQQDDKSH